VTLPDYVVIGIYGALVLAIGLGASRGHQRASELVLAGRALPTWAVFLSMVATELSAATFIGVPHAAYTGDWAFLQLAFGALAGKLLLGLYVIPLYHRAGTVTVYGLLEQRFGPATRRVSAVAFAGGRVLASGVRLFIAALAFGAVTGLDVYAAIAICGVIAGAYTLAGGIRSVVWTDVLQGFVFMAAALAILVVLAIHPLGGLPEIARWGVAEGRMQIFHLSPIIALADVRPFAVGLLGGFFLTLATHGTDYDMVQRLLAARTGRAGGRALIGSALLNFPLTALFLFIGTGIAFAYRQPPTYDIAEASRILPLFALHELPAGARGLVFSGLFAAAMSSFDSAVCAIATTWSVDVLPETRDETRLLRRLRRASVSCCAALLVTALAIARYHAATTEGGGAAATGFGLVGLALSAMTILYGGLLGVFALALLDRRRGSDGSAVAGLIAGGLVGVALFLHPLVMGDGGGASIAWAWWIPISATVAFGVAALAQRSRNPG
jgi:SSS family solute:Na+ symporter